MRLAGLKKELAAAADLERARNMAWFFKTGKVQYGEGDVFIGVTVPAQRRIAVRHRNLARADVARLLQSRIHEHRLTALEILVLQYESGDESVFDFYLAQTGRVNNWDLVDTSAPYIVGEHLLTRPRDVLYKLARSPNIWERRIAMVSTMAFMRNGELKDAFAIAALLLADKHDLIRKAVGWMLREAGKVSKVSLIKFLKKNYAAISRTSLRYAIERFSESERQRIMRNEF